MLSITTRNHSTTSEAKKTRGEMFDIPDAKRVRRADLYSHSRSQSQSPTPTTSKEDAERIQQVLQTRLAALYGPLDSLPLTQSSFAPQNQLNPSPENQEQEQEQDQEQDQSQDEQNEFEFRLFSTPSTAADNPKIQKILLHNEDDDDENTIREGRFLHPRPRTYYFQPAMKDDQKASYAFAAVPGDVVLQRARDRAWGLECPWRVRRIVISTSSRKFKERFGGDISSSAEPKTREGESDEAVEEKKNRTKPNKKRRLILRERERIKKAKQEEKKRAENEKEEREKEKRTRRNREKKVKRKLKEKAKKLGSGGGAAGGDAGGDVEGGSLMDGVKQKSHQSPDLEMVGAEN